jgi:hypothetical protein
MPKLSGSQHLAYDFVGLQFELGFQLVVLVMAGLIHASVVRFESARQLSFGGWLPIICDSGSGQAMWLSSSSKPDQAVHIADAQNFKSESSGWKAFEAYVRN